MVKIKLVNLHWSKFSRNLPPIIQNYNSRNSNPNARYEFFAIIYFISFTSVHSDPLGRTTSVAEKLLYTSTRSSSNWPRSALFSNGTISETDWFIHIMQLYAKHYIQVQHVIFLFMNTIVLFLLIFLYFINLCWLLGQILITL